MNGNKSEAEKKAFQALIEWFEREPVRQRGGSDRYIVCAGLVVLHLLKERVPIEESHYVTPRNQVRINGPFIQRILREHGENRKYSAEGGRTTHSTRATAKRLVERLNSLKSLGRLTQRERAKLVCKMQGWLVGNGVQPSFNRQCLTVQIHLKKSGPQIISDILNAALSCNALACVSQHLVGAKFALRYPDQIIEISRHTADVVPKRLGDFLVGNTFFHVAVPLTLAVIDNCEDNIRSGYRPVLLVMEAKVPAACQIIEIRDRNSINPGCGRP